MMIRIEAKNRREGELLRQGLAQPDVRAFVKIMAVLQTLPSDRARERVLRFFVDQTADPDYWTLGEAKVADPDPDPKPSGNGNESA